MRTSIACAGIVVTEPVDQSITCHMPAIRADRSNSSDDRRLRGQCRYGSRNSERKTAVVGRIGDDFFGRFIAE